MKTVINNWDKLPVVLDLQTVSLIFGVSGQTVKNWLYAGKIKGFKIGAKWFFEKDYIRQLTRGDY